MKTLTTFLLVPFFLISCNSGSVQKATAATDTAIAPTTPAYDNTLPKGRVVDSIACRDGGQDFALYLPASYTSAKPFPCIYLFDPHAHGALPLRMYMALAEKYGFVLVGSNASKNGMQWQTTNDGAKALMADTRTRINIDPKRIYTAGFSGGARVASSIALTDGGIAGVIGCAAGFPGGNAPQSKFSYFGMVGDQDFNLTEMQELDGMLEQNGFTHQLLVFSGKHGWAPAADFQTALLWQQVNAMKEGLQPKDTSLIMALKNDYDEQIAATTDPVKKQTLFAGMIKVLSGVTDMAPYQKRSADLLASDSYKKAVVLQSQLQQDEANQQQDLAKQYTTQDEKWWTKKIAELEQKAHDTKTPAAQMNRRLLNYLGLVSYINSNHAIEVNELVYATTYLHIFKLVDPSNPDQPYLSAQYFIRKGDNAQAITALKEAAALNYSDLSQLLTDPTFTNLQGDAGFKEVVNKVKANATK